jgi:tryptophan synthase alpha chain
MQRITDTFAACRADGRAAFMPYIVAGDPDLATTARLLPALEGAGADLIELGIPFSDPLADGPTNQLGAERALRSGATLRGVLETLKAARADGLRAPVNLMGYYNPFFHYGLERLMADAADAGADGLIIPDLQPDDAEEVSGLAEAHGLATVFLIAPTSTDARLEKVARASRGFVYAVSLTGVTGVRESLPPELGSFLERARRVIDLPLGVGFGISTPGMAREVGRLADGVIVGSAIVRRVGEAAEAGADPVPPVAEFVRSLADALREPPAAS